MIKQFLSKGEESNILRRWFPQRAHYETLAQEIRRLLDRDESFPRDAVHLVGQRIKGHERLLEKISNKNKKFGKRDKVNARNFEAHIEDLLGIKIICLRPRDVVTVDQYLQALHREKRLSFIGKPTIKKPLVLPVDPVELARKTADTELHYEGYASVHYIVGLGKNAEPPSHLKSLKAEIQLRTILEEVWGEIDHKYRYELVRSGNEVPLLVKRMFRTAGWYLRVAGQHLEYACEEVERIRNPVRQTKAKKSRAPGKRIAKKIVPEPGGAIEDSTTTPATDAEKITAEKLLDMKVSQRTVDYVRKRLDQHNFISGKTYTAKEILQPAIMAKFEEIYFRELGRRPFIDASEREVDAVLLWNFAIFSTVQPPDVAELGLVTRLRSRMRGAPPDSTSPNGGMQ